MIILIIISPSHLNCDIGQSINDVPPKNPNILTPLPLSKYVLNVSLRPIGRH